VTERDYRIWFASPKFASHSRTDGFQNSRRARCVGSCSTCPQLTAAQGGGQLGRMLAASASLLNIPLLVLDPSPLSPAKQVAVPPPPLAHITGSFTAPDDIRALAAQVHVLTVEIEHVDAEVLDEIQKTTGLQVHPSPRTLRIIQDKFRQKEHLRARGLPVAEYVAVQSVEGVRSAADQLGLPLMLKSRTLAYDGRGNHVLRASDKGAIQHALDALGDRPLYAEKWVPFAREIAVMVVRTTEGAVVSYPVVETVHRASICHLVFAPLRAREDVIQRAREIAEKAVLTFEGAGVFGVELFLLDDGQTPF
jgi:phosphoribosylaminoimidazole carboxylase